MTTGKLITRGFLILALALSSQVGLHLVVPTAARWAANSRLSPGDAALSTSGTTYYVSKTGSNGDGRSWVTAWHELDQIDWDVIQPGDTILLDGGPTEMIYNTTMTVGESGTSDAPITIKLASEPGRNGKAVIDGGLTYWPCQATEPSPYNENHPPGTRRYGIKLNGQSWINIDGTKWGGIEIRNHNLAGVDFDKTNNNIRLSNLHIHHNTYAKTSDGPGISITGDNITLEKLEIHHNGQDALQGGHLTNFVLQDSYLHDHYCSHPDGIQLYHGTSYNLTIRRNIFHDFLQPIFLGAREDDNINNVTDVKVNYNVIYNSAYGVVSNDTTNRDWKVYNNTIVDIDYEGIHLYASAGGMEVRNNIVYNSRFLLRNGIQSNNLFYQVPNAPSGNRSIEADPQFADKEAGNYQLRASSPAIDRGIDVGLTRDNLGNVVPVGNGVDIGAFEFGAGPPGPTSTPTPSPSPGPTSTSTPTVPTPTPTPSETCVATGSVSCSTSACGMSNFGWVEEGVLARSRQPSLDAFQCLRDTYGIRAVVNLRAESNAEEDTVAGLGMEYLYLPIVDDTAPTPEQVQQFLDFVAEMRAQGKPVLAHCAGGRGRVGTMAAMYRLSRCSGVQESLEEALTCGMKSDCANGGNGQIQAINNLAKTHGKGEWWPEGFNCPHDSPYDYSGVVFPGESPTPTPTPDPNAVRILVYESPQAIARGHTPRDATILQSISAINLNVTVTRDLDPYISRLADYDILWLAWVAVSLDGPDPDIVAHSAALRDYVQGGGRIWASANDNDGWQADWLPVPVAVVDAGDHNSIPTAAAGSLFTTPNAIDPDDLTLDESYVGWDPQYAVLSYREDDTSLADFLQLDYGQGVYLLTTVDTRYSDDDGVNQRMFENGIAYLLEGASQPTPTPSPTGTPTPTRIVIKKEAEEGNIELPMTVAFDNAASNGKYVHTPDGGQGVTGQGWVDITVSLPCDDNYVVWGRARGINSGSNSFYVSVDGGTESLWDIVEPPSALPPEGWTWDRVADRDGADPVVYTLSAGDHAFRFRTREDGSRLDVIEITNDIGYVPSQHIIYLPTIFKNKNSSQHRSPHNPWLIWVGDEMPPLSEVWRLYLRRFRRFVVDHWYRLIKGDLLWTKPRFKTPEQGQDGSDLVTMAYWQLWLDPWSPIGPASGGRSCLSSPQGG